MYTVSLDIPAVQRMVDREYEDAVSDPLSILIAAEEELEFDGSESCSFPQCFKPCKACG